MNASSPPLARATLVVAPPTPNYVRFTTFACGALVMVVEILGSRVLGPFFGVGLYVWTALITVTLAALAAGYALGGRLADRGDPATTLYGVILASGLATLLIPMLTGPVLTLCLPMGMRVGALMSALLLFGPALLLMGCVSPLVVRIALLHPERLGRTVGNLYAISTLGSVAGAVFTGFILIAFLGVNRIFQVTGTLLILLAMGYFVRFRRRKSALAALLLPALLWPPEPAAAFKMADGSFVKVVAARETFHGSLKVIDTLRSGVVTRELALDGLIQGGIELNSGLSIHRYPYFLSLLPRGIHPTGASALVIGLGAGILPTWYAQQGVVTDVVDIDPAVVELAQEYFNFRPNGRVFLQDARHFLATSQDQYDYLLLDVFTGDTTPAHLLSLEAMQLLAARLAPNGVLAINLIGSVRSEPYMTASVVRTVATVFSHTELHAVFDPEDGTTVGNLALIAYQGAERPWVAKRVEHQPIYAGVQDAVRAYLAPTVTFRPNTPSIVLTDDYNPIDFFDATTKEQVRQNIINYRDWHVLLAAR